MKDACVLIVGDSIKTEVQEKVTPDSQKSTFDKATESASSTADKVVGSVQPGRPGCPRLTSRVITDPVVSRRLKIHLPKAQRHHSWQR